MWFNNDNLMRGIDTNDKASISCKCVLFWLCLLYVVSAAMRAQFTRSRLSGAESMLCYWPLDAKVWLGQLPILYEFRKPAGYHSSRFFS